MESESDFSAKVKSLIRRAGLGSVPTPALVFVGVLCAALVVAALVHFWPDGSASADFSTSGGEGNSTAASVPDAAVEPSTRASGSSASSAASSAIAVDVEGAVRKPGVYELSSDARVVDAVDAAGGFARNASRTSVNLAEKLQDGTQVYVATKREAAAGGTASGAGASAGTSAAGTGGSSTASGSSSKVNINTASVEELQTLSGIGPSLSQRIVDYRESKGPFTSIEGIKEVSGIGDTRFESIKDSICI